MDSKLLILLPKTKCYICERMKRGNKRRKLKDGSEVLVCHACLENYKKVDFKKHDEMKVIKEKTLAEKLSEKLNEFIKFQEDQRNKDNIFKDE